MKKPLFILGLVLVILWSERSHAQIADPSISNIQIIQNSSCLDSNETATIKISNFGATIDFSINPIIIILKQNGPNGVSIYRDTINSGFLTNTSSIFSILNNINLHDGGCHSFNTKIISSGGNADLSNDSLQTAYVVCNSRPENIDYHLCQGDSIPSGQGLSITNCPIVTLTDSVLIPFTLSFAGNNPPPPTQCAATGAGAFASGILPTLPTGANILGGEISVTNLSLASLTFSTLNLTRFSLYNADSSLPTTQSNIYHNGLSGGPLNVPFGCFDYLSNPAGADLNTMYTNGVPNFQNVGLGHWSTNRCNASSIYANYCAATVGALKIVYEYIPQGVSWYEQPSGGISISNASALDPLTTTNTILSNSNTNGTYTFYGACESDTNCRVATSLTVSGIQLLNTSVSNVLCNGDSTGTINVNPIGGAPPYSNSIIPNIGIQSSTGVFSSLPAGIYTVTSADANGCYATNTVTISEPYPLKIDSINSTTPSCVPGCDATITISASGGTGFVYFNHGAITLLSNTFFNQCAGTHNVTVTDGNGCTYTSTYTVITPGAPTFSSVSSTPATCGQSNGSISASVIPGSNPNLITTIILPIVYNGTSIPANNLPAGSYTIQAVDGNGCTIITNITVADSSTSNLQIANIVSTPPSCTPGNDGTITVVSSGGLGSLQYSLDGFTYQTSNVFTGLSGGTYGVSVQDTTGCIRTTSHSLITGSPPSFINQSSTPATCVQSDGTISVTASGTTQVTYSIIAPTSFIQNNGTGQFSNLPSGAYTIAVSDANNCSASTTIVVSQQSNISFDSISVTNSLCFGDSTASVFISASGGSNITYSIIAPINMQSANGSFINISAGTYVFKAMDANFCLRDTVISIAAPPPISFTTQSTLPTSCVQTNGTITVSANGGTGTLNYVLQPGSYSSSNGQFTNLSSGTYIITITDANNCTLSSNILVGNQTGILIDSVSITPSSCNTNNGSAAISINSTTPLNYSINSLPLQTNTTGLFANLAVGSYSISVSDGASCSTTTNINVGQRSIIIDSIVASPDRCYGGRNGFIQVYANGGSANFIYQIDNKVPLNDSGFFGNLYPGNYLITIYDTVCNDTLVQNVTIPYSNRYVTLNVNSAGWLCGNKCEGEIKLSTNLTEPHTFTLTTPLNNPVFSSTNTSGVFSNLCPNRYKMVLQYDSTCTKEVTQSFYSGPVPRISTSYGTVSTIIQPKCSPPSLGQIQYRVNDGTKPYYLTYNGITTAHYSSIKDTLRNLTDSTYVIVVEDKNGCADTANIKINLYEPSLDSVEISPKQCKYSRGGEIEPILISNTSVPNISYRNLWTNVSTTQPTNLDSGLYELTITDNYSQCKTKDTVHVPFVPTRFILGYSEVTPASCKEVDDGKIEFINGFNPPYEYYISPKVGKRVGLNKFENLPNGSYFINAENAKGCTGYDSFTVGIIDNRQFFYATSKNSNVHCYGSIRAGATGGLGNYTYSLHPKRGEEIEPGFYEGLCWGDYRLKATDSTGCSISKKFKILEDPNAPRNMFHHFSVYPNPANDAIWIKSDYLFDYEVSLINTLGQCLTKKDCFSKLTKLDVSKLTPGMYILRFRSQVDRFERKVLIHR